MAGVPDFEVIIHTLEKLEGAAKGDISINSLTVNDLMIVLFYISFLQKIANELNREG